MGSIMRGRGLAKNEKSEEEVMLLLQKFYPRNDCETSRKKDKTKNAIVLSGGIKIYLWFPVMIIKTRNH